jgi:hypothetical protein
LSFYLPLGEKSVLYLVFFQHQRWIGCSGLLGGALAVTPAISPMRLIGSRIPRGAQALFPLSPSVFLKAWSYTAIIIDFGG